MKQKGFTLIELLVVVAIIGILAAVGVVAYNGYTKSAKEKVVRTNFSLAKKFMNQQIMSCEMDGEFIWLDYDTRNKITLGPKSINCVNGGLDYMTWQKHFMSLNNTNPYGEQTKTSTGGNIPNASIGTGKYGIIGLPVFYNMENLTPIGAVALGVKGQWSNKTCEVELYLIAVINNNEILGPETICWDR